MKASAKKRRGERKVRATEEDVVGQEPGPEVGSPRGEKVLSLAAVDTLVGQRSVQGPPWHRGGGKGRLRGGERVELKNSVRTAQINLLGHTPTTQGVGWVSLTESLKDRTLQILEPRKEASGSPISTPPRGKITVPESTAASPPSTSAAAEECSVQDSDMGCSGFITTVSCLQQDFKNRQIPVLFESHVSDQIMLLLETQFLIYEMGAWKLLRLILRIPSNAGLITTACISELFLKLSWSQGNSHGRGRYPQKLVKWCVFARQQEPQSSQYSHSNNRWLKAQMTNIILNEFGRLFLRLISIGEIKIGKLSL